MRSNSTNKGSWLYLVLALLVAVILWYMVNAREQIERMVDIRLDYKGLPAGLTVLDGQINRVQVRLRGPRELFRTIEARDMSYTVDLSGINRGMNVIPFDKDNHNAFRMYQVLEVIPSRLTLDVDSIGEKDVGVSVRTRQSGRLDNVTVTWRSIAPGSVRLFGPESVLARIHSLSVEATPDSLSEDSPHIMEVPVLAPTGVEVKPSSVTVEYEVRLKREVISLTRPLDLEGETRQCAARPTRVRLRVAVPENEIGNTDYLDGIRTFINLTEQESTDAGIPIRVTLPEGARLESIAPAMAVLQCE